MSFITEKTLLLVKQLFTSNSIKRKTTEKGYIKTNTDLDKPTLKKLQIFSRYTGLERHASVRYVTSTLFAH